MQTPLLSTLKKYKDNISFHTPAHCGGIVGLSGNELLALDTTELSYSDNLLNPTDVIARSLHLINSIYGASATTYVTGGATSAIHTAIRALKNRTFLVVGETHKSIFNALRINRATAYYVDKSLDLQRDITKYNIDVVIVTSPNYFGITLDLANIATTCHNCNAELLVDASHGAHFAFCDKLPVSATKYADWVIHSCHKTLAVPTGGALLHYPESQRTEVLFALNEVHSSSPSYMMLVAMEHAIVALNNNGQAVYNDIITAISAFENSLNSEFSVVNTD
ncbi:MAG: aminotransferase class V-fold PLP-dependent enzyme, partial [Bacillota bacterium]